MDINSSNKSEILNSKSDIKITKTRITLDQIEKNTINSLNAVKAVNAVNHIISIDSDNELNDNSDKNTHMINEEHKYNKTYEKMIKNNKTIKYLKFLLYSMKFEIKMFEFLDLIRISCFSELFCWIISLITLFISQLPLTLPLPNNSTQPLPMPPSPHNNSQDNFLILIIFQSLHIIRAIVGSLIIFKIPKTYEFLEKIKHGLREEDLRSKSYNNILREMGRDDILPKFESMKAYLLIYFGFTLVLMGIDIIGFFYIFAKSGNSHIQVSGLNLLVTFIFICKLL